MAGKKFFIFQLITSASSLHCTRTKCVIRDLKTTKLVDTETNVTISLHCTTNREASDAEICKQLAHKHAGGLRAFTVETAPTAGGCVNISATTLECVHCSSTPSTSRTIARTTPGWMMISTTNAPCQRAPSRRPNVRLALPYERGFGASRTK